MSDDFTKEICHAAKEIQSCVDKYTVVAKSLVDSDDKEKDILLLDCLMEEYLYHSRFLTRVLSGPFNLSELDRKTRHSLMNSRLLDDSK